MLFSILGPLQIQNNDQVFTIERAPVRTTLLSLLIDEGKPVNTSTLLRRMWDDPTYSATNNLRLHISRLRNQLSSIDPCLSNRISTVRGSEGEAGGYHLRTCPEEIDFTRFKMLANKGFQELRTGHPAQASAFFAQALSLWRGPIGQGCRISNEVRIKFDALEQLQLASQEGQIESLLSLGQSTELLPEILAILDTDPHREKSWVNLIRAYYLSGNITKSLEAFKTATETFKNSLGLDPSPEINRIHISVLKRDSNAVRYFGVGD
ncbi:BTAD domain-containing putative transcriptional regulator [Streptomyces sp. NPDC021093]|uniref:AfsR/SARP family transcriptional regulator n=1 Tax=Streptomyces sp. NPDC021093 TaxID=3365112 RepID=UPI00378E610D